MLWSNECKVQGKMSNHILKKSPIALTYSRIVEGVGEAWSCPLHYVAHKKKTKKQQHEMMRFEDCILLIGVCHCCVYPVQESRKKFMGAYHAAKGQLRRIYSENKTSIERARPFYRARDEAYAVCITLLSG